MDVQNRHIHVYARYNTTTFLNQGSNIFLSGMVEIYMEVKSPTNKIILHQKSLTIYHSSVAVTNNVTGDVIAVDSDAIEGRDAPHEWIEIPLRQTLEPGMEVKVQLHFTGPITNDLKGIYYSSYKADNGETV